MTPEHAIGPEVIKEATKRLVESNEFGSRLKWWLQRGHSSERWIQFEWAYHLHGEVAAHFAAICEHKWLDVSLVPATSPPPLWEAEPSAGIELKWWGNWWVNKKSVEDFENDLRKNDERKYPALALLLFLCVQPAEADPVRDWIRQQVADGTGVPDVDSLRQRFLSPIQRPYFEFTIPVNKCVFRTELYAFGFANAHARSPV